MTTATSPTATSLQDQTPVQIDTELNRIGHQRAVLISRAQGLRRAAKQHRSGRYPNLARAERLEAQAQEYGPQIAELTEQMRPYEAEYDRRGGWPRAFLVQSHDGHVHKSMHCSTCRITTQFVWLTDYSGKDEQAIVEAASELACTTCWPSAPTDVLKRVGEIRRPSDIEREQRAAEKAAKARAAAADAVIDPSTGDTLYKSDRAATNAIASTLSSMRWYGDDHPQADGWEKTVSDAVNALAAKHDTDPATLRADYEARAGKKFAAEARKTLRSITEHGSQIVVDNLLPGLQAWVKANGTPA
ncbi:hypothetical protein [Mycolicibacterium llatzerense]|uniref:hypothetical protein n=1 Tax=Mycolicibacterium llatzerense TaxID=280871 RepID=UPI0021B4FACF|nr:hypothetical protein [Mycolicibacterium llatzerense]MCT7372151.1 hypothetical protein [Mycolicibacterium llatzerense]